MKLVRVINIRLVMYKDKWVLWKEKYRNQIKHEAGYEEIFIDKILSKIEGLNPDNVIPQYHFKDKQGKNRYIDFVIRIKLNNNKDILLPIELDGKTKFDTYDIFDDTLERQNNLIEQFGFLLRYSNKRMFNKSNDVILEINECINQLKSKGVTEESRIIEIQNLKNYTEHLQAELNKIQQDIGKFKKIQITPEDNKLILHSEAIKNISEVSEKMLHLENNFNRSTKKIYAMITSILLLSILSVYLYATNNNNITNSKIQTNINISDSNVSKNTSKVTNNEFKEVCGKVVQIKYFGESNAHVNLDRHYPYNTYTVTFWHFSDRYLERLIGKRICVKGKQEFYKQKLYININNVNNIKIHKE